MSVLLPLAEAKLNFTLEKEIGQEGCNSQVFIAHDLQLDGKICVKRISKADFNHPLEFFNEAKKLYYTSHNNIAPIKYGCQDNDFIYISMPYFKNGSLSKILKDRFLTVREIIRYGIQFLSGLNFIHTKGLIHFDVKPNNVLISDSNEALLTDFGLTEYINSSGLSYQENIYVNHLVPERLTHGNLHNLKHDIYQAGLTLYRMCNGNDVLEEYIKKHSWNDDDLAENVVNGNFPDRKGYLPHIPKKLRKIINKALEVDPDKRYPTVLHLINELSSLEGSVDWRYTYSKGMQTWELALDTKIIKVAFFNNQVITTKTMIESGRETQERENTDQIDDRKKAIKFLENVLTNYS